MPKLTIAIDGPAGSGKSSVARLVASALGYLYLSRLDPSEVAQLGVLFEKAVSSPPR